MQCKARNQWTRLHVGTWSPAKTAPQLSRRSPGEGRANKAAKASGIDLTSLGISVPDIDDDVESYQRQLGATFDDRGVAASFDNSGLVLSALKSGVALVDRSHWGRLRLTGEDQLSFLHNQSTNDFRALQPGQGCDTVFVTATARALDLATALVQENGVLLLVSPQMKQQLLERFDKYIFPADKVEVADISQRCRMFSLMGPEADTVLEEIGGEAVKVRGEPYCTHQLLRYGSGAPVILMVGTGLMVPGYTLIVDEAAAAELYARLINMGCTPMGAEDWERARITAGRPAAGAELTEDYNPLEAGLYHAVSVDKGCYIGQETIAKVSNRNAVKQQLMGLQMSGAAAPGAAITLPGVGEKVGRLTSYVDLKEHGDFGLAYLKCKSKGEALKLEGLRVEVEGQPAVVVELPYATRGFRGGAAVASEGSSSSAAAAAAAAREAEKAAAEKAAAEAAKAERLKAMQERLAAWQAQQKQQ